MECMQARRVRLNRIQHHKYICLGIKKETNTEDEQDMVDKTPQFMGKELQTLYDKDIRIKKLLKEDFKKRAIKKPQEKINQNDNNLHNNLCYITNSNTK